jgi:HlyD family secretion protein
VSGEVTDLKYHTIGGVIGAGQKILDIVPNDSNLIIEARVKTQDIESLYPGLVAKVQLTAYKNRLVPRLDGEVIYVSADAVPDQHNGQLHYIARIKINEEQIAQLNAEVKLYPGMPATVFIVKGTRTFLQYLVSPITDSFYKAFKEK